MPPRIHLPCSTSPVRLLRGALALALAGIAVGCSDSGRAATGEDRGEQGSAITPISGCDYSFARPTPASLSSMGYMFAARYLSGDPASGKDHGEAGLGPDQVNHTCIGAQPSATPPTAQPPAANPSIDKPSHAIERIENGNLP